MNKYIKDFCNLSRGCYDIDALNEITNDNQKVLIKHCEENYHKQVRKAVSNIIRNKSKMVLMSGPSSSGKTTTANKISQELLKKGVGSVVVSIDNFFHDLEDTPLLPDGMPDFENITCVDIVAFNEFFSDILTKRKAKMPIFSFLTHKRDRWENITLDENDVLIIEGIHSLNPDLLLSHQFDDAIYKIYVCVNSVFTRKNKIIVNEQDLRKMRRAYRDTFARNRNPVQTIKQWKHVCEGEDIYISPYKNNADIIIDSTHAYELLIYANYLKTLLFDYTENEEVKQIIKVLDDIVPLTKEKLPANSLLWEFLLY